MYPIMLKCLRAHLFSLSNSKRNCYMFRTSCNLSFPPPPPPPQAWLLRWPLYLSKLVTHANLGHSAAEAACLACTREHQHHTNFLPPTYQRRKEKKKKEPHPFFALCMPKTERGNGRDREADVAYFFGPFLCILTPHMAFLPILE